MKEKRSKRVDIRLTPEEFRALSEIRNKHGKSISELVRQSLLFYVMNNNNNI